jgi:hypothetical protein
MKEREGWFLELLLFFVFKLLERKKSDGFVIFCGRRRGFLIFLPLLFLLPPPPFIRQTPGTLLFAASILDFAPKIPCP